MTRQLFCSVGETRTQLHRDCFDNLYLCCFGARRWRVAHGGHGAALEREPGSVSARLGTAAPAKGGGVAGVTFAELDLRQARRPRGDNSGRAGG